MLPKAIFLDVDNTLLDFDAYVRTTMEAGFAHFGLRPYEPWMFEVFTEENNQLWRRIEAGTLDFAQLQSIRWNLIFDRLSIDFDGPVFEKYFRSALNESAIAVEGAQELLRILSERYILCVASNGPYDQQMHRLALAGMDCRFAHFFISEEMGVSKPDRRFFTDGLTRINERLAVPIMNEECLMVGDSLTSDMAGGRCAGLVTCFYDRIGGQENADCDLVIRRLMDLPPLLERLSAANEREEGRKTV